MLNHSPHRSGSSNDAPLTGSKDPFAQFQIRNLGDGWISVTRATAHRVVAKRTGALAKLARDRRAETALRAEAREHRMAALSVLMEEREAERRNRAWWRPVRVKLEKRPAEAPQRKGHAHHRPTRTGWLGGATVMPSYPGPIIDRMGRYGIFYRQIYYGKESKPGVGRRATKYIWDGAYETEDGRLMFYCNVADTPEEAMAALELIELFNRKSQEGSKALFHAIANVPHQLEPEQMFEIGMRFAEHLLGSRDLPFAMALHPRSGEGDQRNWHIHLIYSARSMVRTGAYEYEIGELPRREVSGEDALEGIRALYATVQTEVAQEAGLNVAYTGLSNGARGLPNAPQKHLGGKRTAKVRAGEYDPVNERNWEIMLAGQAALIDEQLRHAQEAASAQASLVKRAISPFAPDVPVVSAAVVPALPLAKSHVAWIGRVPQPSSILVEPICANVTNIVPPVSNLKFAAQALANPPLPSGLAAARAPRPSPIGTRLSLSDVSNGGKAAGASVPQPSRIDTSPVTAPVRVSRALFRSGLGANLDVAAMTQPSSLPIAHRALPQIAISAALPSAPTRNIAVAFAKPSLIGPSTARHAASAQIPLPRKAAIDVMKLPVSPSVLSAAFDAPKALDFSLTLSTTFTSRERAPDRHRVISPPVPSDAEARGRAATEIDLLHEQAAARRRAIDQKKTADAKRAAQRAAAAELSDDTLDARLAELVRQDQWISDEGDDLLSVTDEVRRAAGLTPEEMFGEAAQRVLRAMVDSQDERLAAVFDDAAGPPAVRAEGGALVLHERFPAELRADVGRWAANAEFRSFAVKVWPHLALDGILPASADHLAEPTRLTTSDPVARTSTANHRRMLANAAGQRETLMAGWNALRPLTTPSLVKLRERTPAPSADRQPIPQRPAWRGPIDPRDIDR